MKRILRICAVGTAALVVGLTMPAAHAICGGTPNTLVSGNFQADPSGGDTHASIRAAIESAWWRFTAGDPADGPGNDNGAYEDDGTGGFGNAWLYSTYNAGEFIIYGNSDTGLTDGCPDADQNGATPDQAVLAVCDATGKWAVATATQDPADITKFVFGSGALVPTPGVVVTNAQRLSTTSHRIFVTAPTIGTLDDAFYAGPGATPTATQVITGVRLYTKTVARDAALSAERRISDPGPPPWTDSGITLAPGAAGQIDITCASNSDTYIGVAPIFDGATPFRSGCVTELPRLVQCGPTLAQPPSKFKKIERPRPRE